jgi:excisionase family DNA binding protein
MASTYFTPEQVAERLHVNVETVRRWIRSRELRCARLSRKCWRIAASDLYQFIEGRK